VLFIHTGGSPVEAVIHGHRLVVFPGLCASYETGSRAAHAVSAGLREAAARAWSRDRTHEELVRAADDMQRRAIS
jgi:tRNA(Arg) A34 adenosine deaminase TadA